MSKKQMEFTKRLQLAKVRKRLSGDMNIDEKNVPNDVVKHEIIKSSIHRFKNMLPRPKKPKGIYIENHNIFPKLPYTPIKKSISWLTPSQQDISSPPLSLSEEIMRFHKYVSLQNEEINCRNDLIHHIQEIVKAKWPNAVVQSFGSYPAGLSTFLSDIDITILEISDDLQRNLYSSNISISNNKWNNDVEILSTDVHVVHESARIKAKDNEEEEKNSRTSCVEESDGVSNNLNFTVDILDEELPITWYIDNGKSATEAINSICERDQQISTIQNDLIFLKQSYKADSNNSYKGSKSDEEKDEGIENDKSESSVDSSSKKSLKQRHSLFSNEQIASSSHSSRSSSSSSSRSSSFSSSSYSNNSSKPNQLQLNTDSFSFNLMKDDHNNLLINPIQTSKVIDLTQDDIQSEYSSSNSSYVRIDDDYKQSEDEDEDDSIGFESSIHQRIKNTGKILDKKTRENMLQCLVLLKKYLCQMSWIHGIELRRRAKIPIISFSHENGIECDISIYNHAKDTTDIITKMKTISGEFFCPLSAFLKTFLTIFNLDLPYTGGIGSFKLYVMIIHIISLKSNQGETSLGALLVYFFSYYSIRSNFNIDTVLRIGDIEETFENVRKIEICRKIFRQVSVILKSYASENGNQNRFPENHRKMHQKHQLSNSILGKIIDAESLQRKRELSIRGCRLHPVLSEEERLKLAENIISKYNREANNFLSINLSDISQYDPILLCRLKSFVNFNTKTFIFKNDQTSVKSSSGPPSRSIGTVFSHANFVPGGVIGNRFHSLPGSSKSHKKSKSSSKRKLRELEKLDDYSRYDNRNRKKMRSHSKPSIHKKNIQTEKLLKEQVMKSKLLANAKKRRTY